MTSDEITCGGVYTLDPDPVHMVIAALSHVQAETGKYPKLSALDVALIAESLIEQGAFRDRLRPAVEGRSMHAQVQRLAELNAYLDDQAIPQ